MGRRQTPPKRRGTPTAALVAAAMLLLLGGLAALMSSGPNMFGMHLDWTASRAAVTNASAITASGLLDRSSLLRSTGVDPVADVAVQPFADAEVVSTQQQGGIEVATSSSEAQATDTQQGGSSSSDSDSGGSGSIEQGADRMIIVAHLAEDLSWLPMHLGDVPTAVYQFVPNLDLHQLQCPPGAEVDRPQGCPRYAAGHTGREASAYLQFIHDHYDSLPATMLFLHGHEKGWHRDSAVALVRKLKFGVQGFANIRHWGFTDWECRHEAQQRGERPCSALGYCLTPGDPKAANDPQLNEPDAVRFYAIGASQMLAEHWDSLFKEELGGLPAMVVEPACCTEFMVTRERVRRRPLSFYRHALDILQAAKDTDSFPLAVSFEAVWHMIFGEPAIVHAVSKCDIFECSEDERSDIRLQAPPVPNPYKLHHYWAAQQQQGAAADVAGFPVDQGSAAEPASASATDTDLAADLATAAGGPMGADQLEAAARQAMKDAAEDSVGAAAPTQAADLHQAAPEAGDAQQIAAVGTADTQQAAADEAIEVLQIDADAIEAQDAAATEATGAQQGAAAGVALQQDAAASGMPEVQPPDQSAPAAEPREHIGAEQQAADMDGQAAAADGQSVAGVDLLVEDSGPRADADMDADAEASPAESHPAAGSGAISEQQGPQHTPAADGIEEDEETDSSSDEMRLAAALEQALASTGQAADTVTDGNAHAGVAATTGIAD